MFVVDMQALNPLMKENSFSNSLVSHSSLTAEAIVDRLTFQTVINFKDNKTTNCSK
jgi:hypothetical protein